MPALPQAFLFIQILFIILSVIYITCFYYLLTFRREKVYIMNALMPRFFLMFSCGPIPGAFLNSGPVTRCFFFYSGILRSNVPYPLNRQSKILAS